MTSSNQESRQALFAFFAALPLSVLVMLATLGLATYVA
jgi:hypothetical protein